MPNDPNEIINDTMTMTGIEYRVSINRYLIKQTNLA